jgi:hypothetical protein
LCEDLAQKVKELSEVNLKLDEKEISMNKLFAENQVLKDKFKDLNVDVTSPLYFFFFFFSKKKKILH